MKIAFVSTMAGVPWGGSELLWSETAKLALNIGHQVFTSTYFWEDKPKAIKDLFILGANSYFRPQYNPSLSTRISNRIKNAFRKVSPEVESLMASNPDRILLNQSGGYDIIFRPDLQKYFLETSKPYFVICHNYNEDLVLSESERALLVRIYSKASCVFMICKVQAQAIKKQLVCNLPNIRIVENPVNLKTAALMEFPEGEKIQIASVASFHVNRKGQDILLEVLGNENWKKRNWQLNLYGSGPDRKYLEDLVVFYGLEGRVSFKGHVENINAVWKDNHLLVISSRIETGPMVLVEAMLCGRPVVSTLVGKVYELLTDGENGFIAPAPNSFFLDQAMERAWENRNRWQVIGRNAFNSANHAVDFNAAETFLKILTEA